MKEINIIAVDDSLVMLKIISSALQKEGYNIETFYRGKVALEKLKENSYDLLITDLLMPGMDGFKLIENVRQENKNIPILVVSANASKQYVEKSYALGIQNFLPKPFLTDDLLSVVSEVLNSNRCNE